MLCGLLPLLLNRIKRTQFVNRRVSFLEVQVVAIRHARVVTHPLADLR